MNVSDRLPPPPRAPAAPAPRTPFAFVPCRVVLDKTHVLPPMRTIEAMPLCLETLPKNSE